MKNGPVFGARHVLASAIIVALSGPVVAVDPTLRVISPGLVSAERVIELSELRYLPGSKLVVARTLLGNIDCGTVSAPAAGVLQLELDGKRYAVRTSDLPTTLTRPVVYAPGTAQVSLSIADVISTNCASTNLTKLDLVAVGSNGQPTARARIAQTVRVHVPDPANPTVLVENVLADPLHCETYGQSSPGLDVYMTYANGREVQLFGVDRMEYRLQEINGRRELRQYPKLSPTGTQLVQCTSPGLLMGDTGSGGAGGGTAGSVFNAGFEWRDTEADVAVALGSVSMMGLPFPGVAPIYTVGFVPGSEGAFVTLSIVNQGRGDASDVKVREYLRNGLSEDARVIDGGTVVGCASIPLLAEPDPCASLGLPLAFPLEFDMPRLRAGHGVALTLHRQLQVQPDSEIDRVEVGYAAFVNPIPSSSTAADSLLGNNSLWVNFAVS